MRRTVWTKATTVGLAVATLIACSSTTSGHPVTARDSSSAATAPATASAPSSPAIGTSSAQAPPEGAAFTDPEAVRVLLADAAHDIVSTNTYDYRRLTDYRRTALAATTDPLTSALAKTID